MSPKPREQWRSRAGFMLAAIGGAIGLGNVWKFPYVAGQYGGASFLIVYVIALFVVALPVIMVELAAGRRTQRNYAGALRELMPGSSWYLLGVAGVIVFVMVLSFYFGISGWALAYLWRTIVGTYAHATPDQVSIQFGEFLNNPYELIFWQLVCTIATAVIVVRGVRRGIEKVCTILLPVLFVMIAALAVWAMLLPGAGAGLKFYLSPDWSKLTGEAVLAAIGQAFFTLGVGCGGMAIYGSYLNRQHTIASSAVVITLGDSAAAFVVGLLIFPAAFALGINPEVAGPPLVFLTLPSVFVQMPYGMVFAALFYLAVSFACLTSTIAILEAVVGYVVDEWEWTRERAVFGACTLISVLGFAQMMSFGPWSDQLLFGKTIFQVTDDLITKLLLPLCGLITLVLAGWVWKRDLWTEINIGKGIQAGAVTKFSVRYLAPLAVAALLIRGLLE